MRQGHSGFFQIALALALLVACGGSGRAGSTTIELTLSDLTGTWDNSSFRLEVNEGGEYVLREPDDPDQIVMGGFVARDGDRFSFVTATTGACPGQTGTYQAASEGDQLTLIVVDDPCSSRAAGFIEPFTLAE